MLASCVSLKLAVTQTSRGTTTNDRLRRGRQIAHRRGQPRNAQIKVLQTQKRVTAAQRDQYIAQKTRADADLSRTELRATVDGRIVINIEEVFQQLGPFVMFAAICRACSDWLSLRSAAATKDPAYLRGCVPSISPQPTVIRLRQRHSGTLRIN
jgi:hypothetical protein